MLTDFLLAALHHVSVRTVESQIAALRRKLGVAPDPEERVFVTSRGGRVSVDAVFAVG